MLKQQLYDRIYRRFKDEYDAMYYDVMENNYNINGKYTRLVENYIKKVSGRRFVHLTNTGTTAVQVSILAAGLVGKKTQLSSYGFNACISPFKMTGNPVFNDIIPSDTTMDFTQIDKSVDCVYAVDWWGHPVDHDSLAENWQGNVICDTSQSFGATYKGKPAGSFGDISVFAFGLQKHFGVHSHIGAIGTDDPAIDKKLNIAINQGKVDEYRYFPHEGLGINGHCADILAGQLWVTIRHWEEFQNRRDKIAKYWIDEFKDLPISIYVPNQHSQSSWYRFGGEIDDMHHFVQYCNTMNIDCRNTYPDNWNDIYGTALPRPNTDHARKHGFSLPLSAQFTDGEVEMVKDAVTKYFV